MIVIMASDDHCRMEKVSDFIKSSAALTSFFLIQFDNCDFEAEEIVNGSLNYFRQKIAADLAEKFASENLMRW